VAGIKAGAFRVDHDDRRQTIGGVAGLYQGVWVTQTTEPIGYDEQGRANHTYTVDEQGGVGHRLMSPRRRFFSIKRR
jgi:hypothetical protein